MFEDEEPHVNSNCWRSAHTHTQKKKQQETMTNSNGCAAALH